MEKNNKIELIDILVLMFILASYISFQLGRTFKEPTEITIKCYKGVTNVDYDKLSNSNCLYQSEAQ